MYLQAEAAKVDTCNCGCRTIHVIPAHTGTTPHTHACLRTYVHAAMHLLSSSRFCACLQACQDSASALGLSVPVLFTHHVQGSVQPFHPSMPVDCQLLADTPPLRASSPASGDGLAGGGGGIGGQALPIRVEDAKTVVLVHGAGMAPHMPVLPFRIRRRIDVIPDGHAGGIVPDSWFSARLRFCGAYDTAQSKWEEQQAAPCVCTLGPAAGCRHRCAAFYDALPLCGRVGPAKL